MKVQSSGANRTIVTLANGNKVGFSYNTPVVAEIDGVKYKTEKKFSKTTSRHCNQMMSEMYGSYAGTKPQSFFDNLA